MEYILPGVRNKVIAVYLAFCIFFSVIILISYMTINEPLYSKYHVKKYKPLKLETVLNNDPVYFNGTWVSDDEILMQDNSGNIILFGVNKTIKSILAFNSMKHMKYCFEYKISADKKYLLIAYNIDTNRSNLSTGNYDVINIKTGKQVTLRDEYHNPREIMSAMWSPTDSSLAIIAADYNIYYIPTVVQPNNVIKMTFNGSKDVYNGIPDRMYAEEIFGSTVAMWFSGRGTKLAYVTFDETSVPSMRLQQYGIPDTIYDQYSKVFDYRYPKVNDPNPTVELFVRDLDVKNESAPVPIKPVKHYTNETILYKVAWSGDEHLFVMWMNRFQDESHLVHYYIFDNNVEVKELMEFRQENGWLDFRRSLMIGPENRIALIFLVEQDNGDSYGHVCVLQTDGKIRAITNGKFEVTKLMKWDFESNQMYYLANTESHPEQQHVYRVLMDLEMRHVMPECLTCDTGCAFNDAELSENNTYYSHTCVGSNNLPYVNIVLTNNGDKIVAWELNKNLHNELWNVRLPSVLFLTVPLVDGYNARVKLLIPPTVDIWSNNKKYPLLIFTEPTNNVALDEFDMDLNTYLSASHGIVVAMVDGRGTGRRGCKTLYENYKRLGTNEIDDQIIVAKFLQNELPYVDKRKTGIWGWRYGGYVAAMVLAKDTENVFQYAFSVAPITSLIYYDSMFIERYMGSYRENVRAYQNASLIENAEGLRHKNYMIIHGLLDNIVNFQHSAVLSKELQHKAILFKQQVLVILTYTKSMFLLKSVLYALKFV